MTGSRYGDGGPETCRLRRVLRHGLLLGGSGTHLRPYAVEAIGEVVTCLCQLVHAGAECVTGQAGGDGGGGLRGVPAPHLVVERVALDRDATGVADHAHELLDLLLRAVFAPATWTISSRTTVPWTSLAPKCSATWASGVEIMIQYALMCGMLSSISRDTARIFRSSEPVVELEAAPLEDGVLGMEGERDEGQEAAGLVLQVAQAHEVVDALLVGLDVAVEHRAVGRHPEPVRAPWTCEPFVGGAPCPAHHAPHAVGEDLRAAARQRAEPGALELGQHLRRGLSPESVVMWWISEAVYT